MCATCVSQQGSLQVPDFEKWRFVPYDGTLLFNFKSLVSSEDEAIALIIDAYRDVLMGIRRVVSLSLVRNWIVIDTCFATNKARLRALKNGVTLKDGTKILPVTTCLKELKYTYLTFAGSPLLPKHDDIMSNVRTWAKSIISNTNKQYFYSRPLTLTYDPLIVWMTTDSFGVFRGKGSAVFRGYDPRLTNNYIYFERSTYEYPQRSATVTGCYMYCEKCQTFNDHESVDCVIHLNDTDEDADETATKSPEENTQNEVEYAHQNSGGQNNRGSKRKLEDGEIQIEDVSEDEEEDNQSTSSYTIVASSVHVS